MAQADKGRRSTAMLYSVDGQPIHCGNCLWGQFVPPSKGEQDPFGRYPMSDTFVVCQLNPQRGDFGFPKMGYSDHCSHHPALDRLPLERLAKPLPVPAHLPQSDWLLGKCFACGAEPGEDCIRSREIRERRRNGIHLSREASAGRAMSLAKLPACPYCDAEPGKPCSIPEDVESRFVHYAREFAGYIQQ